MIKLHSEKTKWKHNDPYLRFEHLIGDLSLDKAAEETDEAADNNDSFFLKTKIPQVFCIEAEKDKCRGGISVRIPVDMPEGLDRNDAIVNVSFSDLSSILQFEYMMLVDDRYERESYLQRAAEGSGDGSAFLMTHGKRESFERMLISAARDLTETKTILETISNALDSMEKKYEGKEDEEQYGAYRNMIRAFKEAVDTYDQ